MIVSVGQDSAIYIAVTRYVYTSNPRLQIRDHLNIQQYNIITIIEV
jgi:hypothetical protein